VPSARVGSSESHNVDRDDSIYIKISANGRSHPKGLIIIKESSRNNESPHYMRERFSRCVNLLLLQNGNKIIQIYKCTCI
jgi:hypothetical protein